jgi:hypothetical protein
MVSSKATSSAIAVARPVVATTNAATPLHASSRQMLSVTTRTKTAAAAASLPPQAPSAVQVLANVTRKKHAADLDLTAPKTRPSPMAKVVVTDYHVPVDSVRPAINSARQSWVVILKATTPMLVTTAIANSVAQVLNLGGVFAMVSSRTSWMVLDVPAVVPARM